MTEKQEKIKRSANKETGKKRRFFFRQENKEEKFPFFYRKLHTSKKTQKRKVNEKDEKIR